MIHCTSVFVNLNILYGMIIYFLLINGIENKSTRNKRYFTKGLTDTLMNHLYYNCLEFATAIRYIDYWDKIVCVAFDSLFEIVSRINSTPGMYDYLETSRYTYDNIHFCVWLLSLKMVMGAVTVLWHVTSLDTFIAYAQHTTNVLPWSLSQYKCCQRFLLHFTLTW